MSNAVLVVKNGKKFSFCLFTSFKLHFILHIIILGSRSTYQHDIKIVLVVCQLMAISDLAKSTTSHRISEWCYVNGKNQSITDKQTIWLPNLKLCYFLLRLLCMVGLAVPSKQSMIINVESDAHAMKSTCSLLALVDIFTIIITFYFHFWQYAQFQLWFSFIFCLPSSVHKGRSQVARLLLIIIQKTCR